MKNREELTYYLLKGVALEINNPDTNYTIYPKYTFWAVDQYTRTHKDFFQPVWDDILIVLGGFWKDYFSREER